MINIKPLLVALLSLQLATCFNIIDSLRKNMPQPSPGATIVAGTAMSVICASSLLMPLPALAEGGSRVVGNIQGSGLVFKDTLTVEAFPDPKIEGGT